MEGYIMHVCTIQESSSSLNSSKEPYNSRKEDKLKKSLKLKLLKPEQWEGGKQKCRG
jgi:hypothetical protein